MRKTQEFILTLECGHEKKSYINSDTFLYRCGECRKPKKRDIKIPVTSHFPGIDRSLQIKAPRKYETVNLGFLDS